MAEKHCIWFIECQESHNYTVMATQPEDIYRPVQQVVGPQRARCDVADVNKSETLGDNQ